VNLLLIDPDAVFEQTMRHLLACAGRLVRLERYDPFLSGPVGCGLSLTCFDAVFIDHGSGSHDGLQSLRLLKARTDCPPVVIVARGGNDAVAVRAMKLGAQDYLPKALISAEWLERLIRQLEGDASPDSTLKLPSAILPSIAGFRVVREVGRGAVSRVYMVVPEGGGAPLIAKVLGENLAREGRFQERFQREYEIIRRIRSRYVGRVFAHGYCGDGAYILMEYLSGGDLRTRFSTSHADQVTVLRVFRQLLAGLSDVHAAGIVHRDLKPHNVMFRVDHSVALVDFGIAKLVGDPSLTVEGSVLGTPLYMSPEVLRGHTADVRSDLYSAGVLLYQMLAGTPPFTGDTAAEIALQHLSAAPPPLPRAQDEFQPLVDALLEKAPERRPGSAQAALTLIDETFYGSPA
jgi:serine/threonine protein kinase